MTASSSLWYSSHRATPNALGPERSPWSHNVPPYTMHTSFNSECNCLHISVTYKVCSEADNSSRCQHYILYFKNSQGFQHFQRKQNFSGHLFSSYNTFSEWGKVTLDCNSTICSRCCVMKFIKSLPTAEISCKSFVGPQRKQLTGSKALQRPPLHYYIVVPSWSPTSPCMVPACSQKPPKPFH